MCCLRLSRISFADASAEAPLGTLANRRAFLGSGSKHAQLATRQKTSPGSDGQRKVAACFAAINKSTATVYSSACLSSCTRSCSRMMDRPLPSCHR